MRRGRDPTPISSRPHFFLSSHTSSRRKDILRTLAFPPARYPSTHAAACFFDAAVFSTALSETFPAVPARIRPQESFHYETRLGQESCPLCGCYSDFFGRSFLVFYFGADDRAEVPSSPSSLPSSICSDPKM